MDSQTYQQLGHRTGIRDYFPVGALSQQAIKMDTKADNKPQLMISALT